MEKVTVVGESRLADDSAPSTQPSALSTQHSRLRRAPRANLAGIIGVIALLSWPEIARLLRAEFLGLKERQFVLAARAYGAGDRRLIFREILPNGLSPVVAAAALQVAGSILLEAGLSFL